MATKKETSKVTKKQVKPKANKLADTPYDRFGDGGECLKPAGSKSVFANYTRKGKK